MYMTTLTAIIAMLAIFAVIVSRPEVRPGGARPGQTCHVTRCREQTTTGPSRAESLPQLSRNRWARRDLARMLMTDDDYAGRISPQIRTPDPDQRA